MTALGRRTVGPFTPCADCRDAGGTTIKWCGRPHEVDADGGFRLVKTKGGRKLVEVTEPVEVDHHHVPGTWTRYGGIPLCLAHALARVPVPMSGRP